MYEFPLRATLSACTSTAGQKQARAEMPSDERQGAKTMERGGGTQVMGEIADVDIREATLLEQLAVPSCIPNRDMAFDLPEDVPFAESLHEVLAIRRVQVERRPGLQRAVNGAPDTHELVVIDVLGEVEREPGIEAIRMLGTECPDVGTMERAVLYPTCISPALGLVHESLREVDADVLTHVRRDELEEDAVAASEIRHDLPARELEERQQPPHSRNGVRVVVVDVALIVDGPKFFFGPTTGADLPLGQVMTHLQVRMRLLACGCLVAVASKNPAGHGHENTLQ
jgi:hypothetical protein